MELNGKLTSTELKGVGKLVRSRWYWLRWLVSNVHGLIVMGAILSAAMVTTIHGDRTDWLRILLIWVLFMGICVLAVTKTIRATKRELEKVNRGRPDLIRLTDAGVRTQSSIGVTSDSPWRAFRAWRSNDWVTLLDLAEGDGYIILPTSGLSASSRQLLAGTLISHLGNNATRK